MAKLDADKAAVSKAKALAKADLDAAEAKLKADADAADRAKSLVAAEA